MKRKVLIFLLVMALAVGSASAQFGSGIVYDPTNYHNALLRYFQLQQHLMQLQQTYAKVLAQYNLALSMAKFVQNMPARYRALFSQWRNVTSLNTFGNTGSWISGINSGLFPNINTGYLRSTNQLSQYSPYQLSGMDATELGRVQSQYASIELADGANINAMATIGAIRGNAQGIETQIGNLEQDSFSNNSDLNSEVSVLNKINASGVLTLTDSSGHQQAPRFLARTANHPGQAATRRHHQRHQHRYRPSSQHGREYRPRSPAPSPIHLQTFRMP